MPCLPSLTCAGPKQKTTPKGLGSSLSSGRAGSSAGSATRGGASAPSEAQMLAELASALRMPGAGGPGASLPSEAQMLAELASALRMPGAGGPGASLPSEAQMLAQLFSALGMPGAGPPGFAAGAAPGGAALPSISANHTTTPQYASAWRQMCALHKQEGKGYLAAFLSTQPDLAALQAAGKDTEALTEATERLCLAAQHHAATQSGPAAIAVLQSALKEAMSSLHLDHAAILELNFSLAHMHQEAGQFEAAWAKWRWVIPRSSRLSGHEWRDGFRVRHLGTQCLRQLGRWGECVPLADEMLKICQSTFSGQYRERKEMDSLNILLLCHQYTPITPPQRVLRYAQLHLEHLRRTDQGGSMAFHMQQDMLVMQQAYREMGDYDAAKKLCKEMVAAAKRAFGVGSEEYVEVSGVAHKHTRTHRPLTCTCLTHICMHICRS